MSQKSLFLLRNKTCAFPLRVANVTPPVNVEYYLPSGQEASYGPVCFCGIKRRLSAASHHSTSQWHHEIVPSP